MKHHTTQETPNAISYGYCQCGCGQKTTIASHTDNRHGAVKGQPRRYRPGHNNSQRTIPLAIRFWRHVNIAGPDDCWEWQAGRDDKGYGHTEIDGHTVHAHRVAYELTVGPIPHHLFACHTCNNPSCCNPAHTYPGTNADNVHDAMIAETFSPPPHFIGTQHHSAKLTEDQVRQIREQYADGTQNQYQLAATFGVTKRAIWAIIHRKTWIHVR